MAIIRIPLTKGKYALIDEEDYELVSPHAWRVNITPHTAYAITHVRRPDGKFTTLSMHRLIMRPERNLTVDHIDFDGLNNTRANLRICSQSQNIAHRRAGRLSKAGFKGVIRILPPDYVTPRWVARIKANGIRIELGKFLAPEEAARAYDLAALKYHGEFAHLNFPELREEYERMMREDVA